MRRKSRLAILLLLSLALFFSGLACSYAEEGVSQTSPPEVTDETNGVPDEAPIEVIFETVESRPEGLFFTIIFRVNSFLPSLHINATLHIVTPREHVEMIVYAPKIIEHPYRGGEGNVLVTGLKPGDKVSYYWELEDNRGNILITETKEVVYE